MRHLSRCLIRHLTPNLFEKALLIAILLGLWRPVRVVDDDDRAPDLHAAILILLLAGVVNVAAF
jgi:hypothetical protein